MNAIRSQSLVAIVAASVFGELAPEAMPPAQRNAALEASSFFQSATRVARGRAKELVEDPVDAGVGPLDNVGAHAAENGDMQFSCQPMDRMAMMQSGRSTQLQTFGVGGKDTFAELDDPFDSSTIDAVLFEPPVAAPALKTALDVPYWFTFSRDVAFFAAGSWLAAVVCRSFLTSTRRRIKAKKAQPFEHACTPTVTKPPVLAATDAGAVSFDELKSAARAGEEQPWQQILDRTPDIVSRTDVCSCTALHIAAQAGCAELTRTLLERGADVDARDDWEETPLHFAARAGSVEVCDLLLNHGAEVNSMDSSDRTPLLAAAHAGAEGTCEYLLGHGGACGGATDAEMPPILTSLLFSRMLAPSK
mmetsp:Transcript_73122/g.202805  ORF Transcript_73122/g.202805 Transcript_73122/m.202805 type:complete len:362 (-) Transcript_73122:32-1117(-)